MVERRGALLDERALVALATEAAARPVEGLTEVVVGAVDERYPRRDDLAGARHPRVVAPYAPVVELTFAEGRVLGCLVEKQLLTPQAYPLTDNALVAACNQTTSRDPLVHYDVPTVRLAVRSLRESNLLKTRHGERADKHEHRLGAALGLSPAEVALLAVLLLRGPQTPGELRGRTERMHAFDSVEEVERVLDGLADRPEPLVTKLERQPGRKEVRYVDALVLRDGPPGLPPAPPRAGGAESPASLAALASEVADLRAEVAELRAALSELRDDAGL